MIFTKNVQGHKLVIDTDAKYEDAVYNTSYDLNAGYIGSKYISIPRGTAQVREYQIIYGCTILIDFYTGKVYKPITTYEVI